MQDIIKVFTFNKQKMDHAAVIFSYIEVSLIMQVGSPARKVHNNKNQSWIYFFYFPKLFDKTSILSSLSQSPCKFLTGGSMTTSIDFFVALLNSPCSVVLGCNWLIHYNPFIDWVLGSIIFLPVLIGCLCVCLLGQLSFHLRTPLSLLRLRPLPPSPMIP